MRSKSIKKPHETLIGKQTIRSLMAEEEYDVETKSIEIWEPMFPPGSDKAMAEFLKEHCANASKND